MDLSVGHDNLNLMQERLENTLELTGIGRDFLNRISITQTSRQATEK